MKSYWLNRQNNQKLIVFFAGWSFDQNPFAGIDCGDYDVLFVCDYNEISPISEFKNWGAYSQKILLSWSMGVFSAYLLRDWFKDFDLKIAINGTTSPVDDDFGIPQKIFLLTLKHAQSGLKEKFYSNVFLTEDEFSRYKTSFVKRPIENRISELEHLYKIIKNTNIDYEKFYDCAVVSDYDKIIPPKNQINCHQKNNIPVKHLPFGHFPFYNYNGWKDLIECIKN